jgi:steroid delta-isomerase-like uncharacterized protein
MVEDFVCAWLSTYGRGDLDTCMACYADDAIFDDPIFDQRVIGKAAIQEAFAEFFFSGVTQLHFLEWNGGPDGGAVQWEWTANWGSGRTFLGFDASNKAFKVRGVTALKLRDLKIIHQTDYWDAYSALKQLGALDQ